MLALTTDGGLFSWGAGYGGRLGNGSTEDSDVPQLVQALKDVPIASTATGYKSSLALARSGEIWGWGQGPPVGYGTCQKLPKVMIKQREMKKRRPMQLNQKKRNN